MPTVEMNRVWCDGADSELHWTRAGEEWSDAYGDLATQWLGLLLPRLHPFVPMGTLLEIAPGFGRWTALLHRLATRLIVMDLAERRIQACRERFRAIKYIEYHTNDVSRGHRQLWNGRRAAQFHG